MRVVPPPLSVTLPPPSMTIFGPLSLNTLAGLVKVMVVGIGAAVEGDDAARGDRRDERVRRAALRRPVADDRGRIRDVLDHRLGRDGTNALGIARIAGFNRHHRARTSPRAATACDQQRSRANDPGAHGRAELPNLRRRSVLAHGVLLSREKHNRDPDLQPNAASL